MTKRTWLLVTGALTFGLLSGIAVDRALAAQQTGITRKVLLTTDDPANASADQLVMALVEIAPGASTGKHKHPGIEIGYMIDGVVELQSDGKPALTVTAGESFRNEGVHNALNKGTKPARLIAVYAVEKNKPLTEAVK
jgi:quercetin dioxygenase-like cupin family protein